MAEIVLAALNAKYIHSAFGLRYLMANLGPLQSRAVLAEFDINQRPLEIAEALLARAPKIVGLGIYIWNVALATELVALLKRIRPQLIIILGGPEISHETEAQPITHLADYVITGEADLKFAEVCAQLLANQPPAGKIMAAPLPDFSQLALPYEFYTEDDIAHRLVYVEASRGCPFQCEFCLSSLDETVRQAPLPELFRHLQRLLDRGAKQLKFVDRTFNLNLQTSQAVLSFLLERHRPGLFFHFEVVPDHLPKPLREIIRQFPPGALQFEAGVQTFSPEVAERIKRRQDYPALEENLRFLREETHVHIHADLIVGLPGESLESLAAGFDRLILLRPQEIQVGLLKRLRGAPIARHDAEWEMLYNPHPPYDILQNNLIDFATMQRLRRLARYWDLVANSGNFLESTPLIWQPAGCGSILPPRADSLAPRGTSGERAGERGSHCRVVPPLPLGVSGGQPPRDDVGSVNAHPMAGASPFWSFLSFSDWLFARVRRTDSISLLRLMEQMFCFLTEERKLEPIQVAETMRRDYQRGGRKEAPGFLASFLTSARPVMVTAQSDLPKRQARHLGGHDIL